MLRKFTRRRIIIVMSSLFVLSLGLYGQPKILHAENSLYISQVQITGGSGHTAEDFIELFNPGSEPVNLKNLRLVKRTAQASQDSLIKSWTADAFIPAHGFYLWTNAAFSFSGVTADVQNTATLADDNGIALRSGSNDSGLILDSAAWGNTNNGFKNVSTQNPAANQALLRQDLYNAQSVFILADSHPRNSQVIDSSPPATDNPMPDPASTGTNTTTSDTASASSPSDTSSSTDITSGTDSTQCTTAAPISDNTGSADTGGSPEATSNNLEAAQTSQPPPSWSSYVKISEILPNPAGEDGGNEAVEIENYDDVPVNLENWLLDDSSPDSAPKDSAYSLPAITILPNQVAVIVIPAHHFALNNTGDTVNLFFPSEYLADSISFDGQGKEGETYQKIASGWQWGPASLGLINPMPTPPAVEDFTSTIATPASSQIATTAAPVVAANKTSAASAKIPSAKTVAKTAAKAAETKSTTKTTNAATKSAKITTSDAPTVTEDVAVQADAPAEIPALASEDTAPAPPPNTGSSHHRWWIYALGLAIILGAAYLAFHYLIDPAENKDHFAAEQGMSSE